MADQPRRFTASGYLGDGWQRIRRDDPESSSALRNGSGALVPTLSALDKIMARFDQLEFKLDARARRVDRLKATSLPKPDQPYFSDDGDVDGYRSQGDVWPTDEDGPPVFNHGRRVRCGDVRRRRGTGRDLNRLEAGLAQPGSGTIPYRAHTASWPRTSWDRPAARVTTEFDRGFRGYQQPTSWDPPINRPSCWDPPGNRPISSFQPYDPPRSWQPSCWEPPPHRASQGYSDYDQPPDEELCYETELIPLHHSSSLDQELDAHHKTEEKSSVNWMCSFLDEVDESKSSILNDNHDKATSGDDEFTEMECHSVKISDDSDLQGDSSSQKCLDSDDDNEDAAVPLPTSLPAAIPSSMKKREAGTIVDMVVAQTTAIAEKISYLTNVAWAYESVWATGTDVAAQLKISYGVAAKSVALNDWASINLTRKYGREFMKHTESSMFLKSFGWNKFSVIEFDPGGDTSKLQFLTFFVVSWFPP